MPDLIRVASLAMSVGGPADRSRLFEDFDLTIARGDFVAVVGPSGSGKTTFLELLGAVERPESGRVLFEGARLDELEEAQRSAWRARNVGFVFQSPCLLPALSAVQNVELPLLLTRLPRRERRWRAEAALERLGVLDCAGQRPNRMSGEQQQKTAIARAIAGSPRLLLCDEPTGNLNRASSERILSALQALNEALGLTIVMATDDLAAARYARRTIQLDKGRPELRDLARQKDRGPRRRSSASLKLLEKQA